MYKPTSPQSSFLEPCYLLPKFLPENDWSNIFRNKIWNMIDETKFEHLYSKEGGAPNKSIRLKLSLLIFMSMETLTWRQAEFLLPRRLDWLHATHSSIGDAFIDHTTLFKFYLLLEKDDKAFGFFADLTNKFIEECGTSTKKQRTDSFFMHGWLAIISRYGLFKETIRSFLLVLRKHQPKIYSETIKNLSRDYLEDSFDLTEKDKEKTQRKVTTMAKDLYLLKGAFENHEQISGYSSYKTLVLVFEQQCETTETDVSGNSIEVEVDTSTGTENKNTDKFPTTNKELKKENNRQEIRFASSDLQTIKESIGKKSGNTNAADTSSQKAKEKDIESLVTVKIRKNPLGEKIISSPHNTDAEYTKKRKQTVVGHKVFVTETCDLDNSVQFITDVSLEGAKHSDSAELPNILDRLDKNGMKVEQFNADAGFINGKNILESNKLKIDLIGPSAGRSQDLDAFAKKDRPLDVADFKVSLDEETKELTILECPNKQTPTDQKRSEITGGMLVHFDANICRQCPKISQCLVKQGKKISTLNIDEEQYAGACRNHLYCSSTDYRKKCAIRAGAESLVNEVANSHNARRSRHKTQSRSQVQVIFSAIACNMKRYLRYVAEPQKGGKIALA